MDKTVQQVIRYLEKIDCCDVHVLGDGYTTRIENDVTQPQIQAFVRWDVWEDGSISTTYGLEIDSESFEATFGAQVMPEELRESEE